MGRACHSLLRCTGVTVATRPDFFELPVKFANIDFIIPPFHHMYFANFRAGKFTAFGPRKLNRRNADVIAFNIPIVASDGIFFNRAFASHFALRT